MSSLTLSTAPLNQPPHPEASLSLRSWRVCTRDQIIRLDSQQIHAVLPLLNLAVCLLDENTAQATDNSQVEYDDIIEYGRRVTKVA